MTNKTTAKLLNEINKLNNKIAELKNNEIERKRIKEELIKSEKKYRNLFENAEIGMYSSKLDGTGVVAANKKLVEIIGTNLEEILSNPAFIYWENPNDRETMIRKLIQDGSLFDYEIHLITKNGEKKTCLLSGNVFKKEGIFEGALIDITKRKQAEEKLKATNQLLTASEQQLRASNQQLTASEQQQRASNQQLTASDQQLRAANQQLTATEQQLRASNQQLIAHEKEILKRAHDLGERVKELDCLYGIAESIRTKETIEEVLQDTANIISSAWQYPKITRGKVRFNGKDYVSQAFKESKWKQSADIIVDGKVSGAIEVYYLEECPELDEGPFMKEERNLITGLAITIGKAIKRMQAEKELKATNQQLIASEQQLRAANQQLTASEQQLRASNQQLVAHKKELIESKYQLEETQEIAGLGSYVLDIASGIWKSSSILDNIFGLDKKYKKDISGWLQIIHPEDKTMMQDYFATNVLINRELFNIEYRIKRINDQQERWVHGMGKLEFNDDEDPIKMIGTIQDITERKRVEEKLISRNKELELFNEVTVGRELKMIELKKEINELLEKSGKMPKYKIIV